MEDQRKQANELYHPCGNAPKLLQETKNWMCFLLWNFVRAELLKPVPGFLGSQPCFLVGSGRSREIHAVVFHCNQISLGCRFELTNSLQPGKQLAFQRLRGPSIFRLSYVKSMLAGS